ncbi:serine/threonine protein kinase [Anaerosporobacter sp.]|uniref:serine/threonine protein kinase n=1 Tax=Anaerosporobacter sp. TaxID=1872529 RepID=UPI00286F70B1|nr:serine/threonine-protein kinase [Anaerosporobacter sp.]
MLEKYQVIKKLGTGGTSTVFLAKHRFLHSLRVIKCRSKSDSINQHSLKESIILSQLHHSRIPAMYDIEEDERNTYLIMEYCDGKSLKSLIRTGEVISEERILQLSLQICEVIQYLHNQKNPILYLDLKPDNILVSGQEITLIDYGSARYKNEDKVIEVVAGTIGYAAPEQYTGGVLSEKTDIYGIGMVMYSMVTGVVFVSKDSYIENVDLKGRCSKQLKKIINRCIKENPKLRYQGIEQVITALSKIQKRGNNNCKAITSLTIAVAGVQTRVGTTHIALAFNKYLNQFSGRSLYIENNSSGHSIALINSKGNFNLENGIYVSKYLQILPCVVEQTSEFAKEYDTVIVDYGILTEENRQEFAQADICLLVMTSKPWEMSSLMQDRIQSIGKPVVLLLNLTSLKEYEYVLMNIHARFVYRIPYISDILLDSCDKSVWELLHTMLMDLMEIVCQESN